MAADISAICTAWPCAITRGVLGAGGVHHRGDVVHPILRCCGRSERVGEPDPAHVEPEDAREASERGQQLLDEGLLPEHLEVTRPVQRQDDVAGPVADYLVGEMDLTAARVAGDRRRHGTILSQRPPSFDDALTPSEVGRDRHVLEAEVR